MPVLRHAGVPRDDCEIVNGVLTEMRIMMNGFDSIDNFTKWLNKKYPDIDVVADVANGNVMLVFTKQGGA